MANLFTNQKQLVQRVLIPSPKLIAKNKKEKEEIQDRDTY